MIHFSRISPYFIFISIVIILGSRSAIAYCTEQAASDSTIKSQPSESFLSKSHVLFDFGFAHWASDRFRTAALGKDFGFGVTVNPGIPYLILKGRYDFSTIRTVEGDTLFGSYNGKHIGFTTLEVGGFMEFPQKANSLHVNASGGIVLVGIEDQELTAGLSAAIGVNYLFSHPDWKRLGIGVSLNILSRTYNISNQEATLKEWMSANKVNLDRDLNLILGVGIYF
jgi:hypothetical protein